MFRSVSLRITHFVLRRIYPVVTIPRAVNSGVINRFQLISSMDSFRDSPHFSSLANQYQLIPIH